MIARRWLVAAGAVALVAAAFGWAFTPRPLAVEAAPVSSGPFEMAVEDDGKTRLVDQYTVSAPLSGQLLRIGLREGDAVAAGAVLAQLRPAIAPLLDERTRRQQQARVGAAQAQVGAAHAAVERAEVALQRARHEARRTEQLGQAGFVAPSRIEGDQLAAQAAQRELDSAMAQRQIAVHDVEQARAALDAGDSNSGALFPIRAPVAGRVLRVLQPSEAAVALGAPLMELGDPARLEVVAELLTADAILAGPGSPVRIDRYGGPALAGRVRRIEPAAFTKISALGVEEQRVRVLIDLIDLNDLRAPAAAGVHLGVGYRVNVRVMTSRQDKVDKVPVSAVFPLPGKSAADGAMAVYLVRDGRARLTALQVRGRNDAEAWIEHGPAAGSQVIVYPPVELRDGDRVRVRDVARQR